MNSLKTNYHSHSTYSDGENSIKEMIEAATTAGFKLFGISDHAPVPFRSDWNMASNQLSNYLKEIQGVAKESSIKVLAGIELEYLRGEEPLASDYIQQLDYTIGSVHYLKAGGRFWELDSSYDQLMELLKCEFNNDVLALTKSYTNHQCEMLELYKPTQLGHIDLLAKYNEKRPFFKEESPAILHEYEKVLELAKRLGTIIEINYGAIARGHRSSPYPNSSLRRRIKELGIPMVKNGDFHSVEQVLKIAADL